MKVFKFGGASVKDAKSVENIIRVLNNEGYKNTVVVISAMGKMTNAFEKIVNSYFNKSDELIENIDFARNFHIEIINNLFPKEQRTDILTEIEIYFGKLSGFFITNKKTDYNYIYDQTVGFGELVSTKIISSFLNFKGIKNEWLDVRDYIQTDKSFRNAKVNWKKTSDNIEKLSSEKLYITQGFLGSNSQVTTTLGREGSDYSAGIFAYCLNAESVTIWKDVEGVLNADPRHFKNAKLLRQISYSEAIEMAFFGASVIHPKTLKPLENKNIPLFVRSFQNLNSVGTTVSKGHYLEPELPCFIFKQNQILVSISALDFSFMVENNLSEIFKILHKFKLKVNLIQNSALSFSVCIEDQFNNFDAFISEITQNYKVSYFEDLKLYTVRHATKKSVELIEQKGEILLKQSTKGTVQLIMK